jgi:ketosteroid isomerase-like protein
MPASTARQNKTFVFTMSLSVAGNFALLAAKLRLECSELLEAFMRTVLLTILACCLLGTSFVGRAPASPKSMTPDMLRKMEAEFMQAAAERGSAGYMSYYAEDAVELPNGEAVIQGKAAIAKTMGFLDNKENRLTWAPVGADVSGDIGYTYGTYEFHGKDKDGVGIVDYGKYTSIWKRQKDGSWKIVLDMGNGNGPSH